MEKEDLDQIVEGMFDDYTFWKTAEDFSKKHPYDPEFRKKMGYKLYLADPKSNPNKYLGISPEAVINDAVEKGKPMKHKAKKNLIGVCGKNLEELLEELDDNSLASMLLSLDDEYRKYSAIASQGVGAMKQALYGTDTDYYLAVASENNIKANFSHIMELRQRTVLVDYIVKNCKGDKLDKYKIIQKIKDWYEEDADKDDADAMSDKEDAREDLAKETFIGYLNARRSELNKEKEKAKKDDDQDEEAEKRKEADDIKDFVEDVEDRYK